MDNKLDFVVPASIEENSEVRLAPLSELQLALVGGGSGDVIFA